MQNTPVAQTRSVGRTGSHLHLKKLVLSFFGRKEGERNKREQSSCGGRGEPWEALLAKPGQRVRDFIVRTIDRTCVDALF